MNASGRGLPPATAGTEAAFTILPVGWRRKDGRWFYTTKETT